MQCQALADAQVYDRTAHYETPKATEGSTALNTSVRSSVSHRPPVDARMPAPSASPGRPSGKCLCASPEQRSCKARLCAVLQRSRRNAFLLPKTPEGATAVGARSHGLVRRGLAASSAHVPTETSPKLCLDIITITGFYFADMQDVFFCMTFFLGCLSLVRRAIFGHPNQGLKLARTNAAASSSCIAREAEPMACRLQVWCP